jgi:uncharacterized protein
MCDVYCKSKSASPEDFDCVVENVCNAADKTDLSIRMNVPKNDANEAIAITDYFFKHRSLLGKARIYFAFVREYSLSPNELKQAYIDFVANYFRWVDHVVEHYGKDTLSEEIPKRVTTSCGIIKACNACIGALGELHKCDFYLGDDSKAVGDIWSGQYYNDTELAFLSTVDTHDGCSHCAYLPVCMGGCATHRILGYGNFDCEASRRLKFKLKLVEGGMSK